MSKYKTLKQSIGQILLIVLSVVLGLYLSERIEERKNQRAADNILAKVKAEVSDNAKLMEYWAPYHEEVYLKLDSLTKDEVFVNEFIQDKNALFGALFTRPSFMSILPSKDAWDIAKAHPLIVNFEYDKLVVLSRIYNQQERTFEPMYELIELLKSKEFNRKQEAQDNLEVMSASMFELVAREKQLVTYYKEAGTVLDLGGGNGK